MNTNDEDDVGVVFRKTTGHYTVHTRGRKLDCSLSSLIHKQLIFPTADPTSLRHAVQEVRELDHVDPVAIGDRVRFVDAGDGRGQYRGLPGRPGGADASAGNAGPKPRDTAAGRIDSRRANGNHPDQPLEIAEKGGFP